MQVNPQQLPYDVALLRQMVLELLETLHRSEREKEQLRHRLTQLLRARFGPRAEKIDPNQMALFAQEILKEAQTPPPPPPEAPAAERPKAPGHARRKLPEHLPRKTVLHDVSPEDRQCPGCGQEMVKIGTETSEPLEYVPASLYVLVHERPKYACPECPETVAVADKPRQPIEKGLPGPGRLAQVITSKYADHLPLNRQTGIFRRHGVALHRSTLCDWMRASARLLTPLTDRMIEEVLASDVLHTDDTPMPVLDKDRDSARLGRLWAYVGDDLHPYTIYDYTPSRARDGPVKFLGDFEGYMQADAYGGYDGIYAGEKVIEVLCWAHARRKFFDAIDSDHARAHAALAFIRRLYEIEKRAKDMPSADRARLRQVESRPILEAFRQWLGEPSGGPSPVLPKSPMGLATNYVLGNWAALVRYTDDGDLSIDNNAAEQAMRPVALGRRNYLFCGSDNGGRTAAVLYSLIATCRRHGLDPYAYLRDVIARISDHPAHRLDELLPDRWKLARLSAVADLPPASDAPDAPPSNSASADDVVHPA